MSVIFNRLSSSRRHRKLFESSIRLGRETTWTSCRKLRIGGAGHVSQITALLVTRKSVYWHFSPLCNVICKEPRIELVLKLAFCRAYGRKVLSSKLCSLLVYAFSQHVYVYCFSSTNKIIEKKKKKKAVNTIAYYSFIDRNLPC